MKNFTQTTTIVGAAASASVQQHAFVAARVPVPAQPTRRPRHAALAAADVQVVVEQAAAAHRAAPACAAGHRAARQGPRPREALAM